MSIDEARRVVRLVDNKRLYPTQNELAAYRVLAKHYGLKLP